MADSKFISLGQVKASKKLDKAVAKELRGSELGLNLKLYMPGVKLVVSNKAVVNITFGKSERADFVVGFANLALGSLTAKKGTSKGDTQALQELGNDDGMGADLRLEVYLGKDDSNELTLKDGDMIHLSFKPHKDSPDFVVANASLMSE
jgi:hypothetical protein